MKVYILLVVLNHHVSGLCCNTHAHFCVEFHLYNLTSMRVMSHILTHYMFWVKWFCMLFNSIDFFILLVLNHSVAGLRWIHMLTFAWNFINMTQRALLCSYVPYTHPLHVDLKFTNETPEWLNVYATQDTVKLKQTECFVPAPHPKRLVATSATVCHHIK